jgi:hypothetical protein
MDFRYTPDQERFRDEIRSFLAANVSEALRHEIATSGHSPGPLGKAFLRLLGERGWLGWAGRAVRQRGRSMIEQTIFYELFLQDIHYGNLTITSLAMTLITLASEEQTHEYLPRILKGELELCLGYTEPGAGSDLAGIITRAEREGTDYLITGQKVFTTGAHYASHCWLLARSEPAAPRHKGLSVFIFPLDTPGVTIRPIYTMEGIRTNEVFLDDVRVAASAMIGPPGSGFHTAAVALDYGARLHGQVRKLRRDFAALVRSAKRQATGRRHRSDPVIRDRLVGLHLDIEAAPAVPEIGVDDGPGMCPAPGLGAEGAVGLEQRLADEGIPPRAAGAARYLAARRARWPPGAIVAAVADAALRWRRQRNPARHHCPARPGAAARLNPRNRRDGTEFRPGTATDQGRGTPLPRAPVHPGSGAADA